MQNSLTLTFAVLAQVRYPAVLAGLREFCIRKRRIAKSKFNSILASYRKPLRRKFHTGYMSKDQERPRKTKKVTLTFAVLAQVRYAILWGWLCGDITIINCYVSWQGYENFAFAKEEFLNGITMFLRFLSQTTAHKSS